MNTVDRVRADLDALPKHHKTRDVDRLIMGYVRERLDVSTLRPLVLDEQRLHRVYFHTSLKQIPDANARLRWIDDNLLFSDWWHTDQLIDFVKDADFSLAHGYAARYVTDADPFVRRWGYVMFISRLCRREERLSPILSLMHDDDHYYVQMAEAWLIAELAVFFPEAVHGWLAGCGLKYDIAGKAIQKMCDSYRITGGWKDRFKALRPGLKENR